VCATGKGYVSVKQLSDADKRLLWRYRKRLVKYSRGLLALFHATRWDKEAHVLQVFRHVFSAFSMCLPGVECL